MSRPAVVVVAVNQISETEPASLSDHDVIVASMLLIALPSSCTLTIHVSVLVCLLETSRATLFSGWLCAFGSVEVGSNTHSLLVMGIARHDVARIAGYTVGGGHPMTWKSIPVV